MKLVRRIGLTLLVLAFALALATTGLRYAGESETANITIIGFAGAMLLGVIALSMSAVFRLTTGEVKLRPWLALKPALFIFVATLTLTLLAWVLFPGLERNLTDAIMRSLLFALGYSLYTTAYRKPA